MLEFRDKFLCDDEDGLHIYEPGDPKSLESFITTALTELSEQHVREMEGLKKDTKTLYPDVVERPDSEFATACEGKNRYNQGVQDCINLIKKQDEK